MVKITKRRYFADEICLAYGFPSAVILNTFAEWAVRAELQNQTSKKGLPCFSCTFDGLLSEFYCLRGEEISSGIETLINAEILYRCGTTNPKNTRLYFGVNWKMLEEMGLGDIKRLATEDLHNHTASPTQDDGTLFSDTPDDIKKILDAYPDTCPTTDRVIIKSKIDEATISAILKDGVSVDDFVSGIECYVAKCKKYNTFLPNFSTFLARHASRYIYTQKQPVQEAIDITIPEEPIAPQAPVAPQPQPQRPQPQPQPTYQPQPAYQPQPQRPQTAPLDLQKCVARIQASYPTEGVKDGYNKDYYNYTEGAKTALEMFFERKGLTEYDTVLKVLEFKRSAIQSDWIEIQKFVDRYDSYKDEYEKSIPKIRMNIVVYVSYYKSSLAEEIATDFADQRIDSNSFLQRWGISRDVYDREFRSKGLNPPVAIIDDNGRLLTQSEIEEYIHKVEEEKNREREMYADY